MQKQINVNHKSREYIYIPVGAVLTEYADKVITFRKRQSRKYRKPAHEDVDKINEVWKQMEKSDRQEVAHVINKYNRNSGR